MHILLNTNTIRHPLTGIGRYTLELARELNRLGHEVHGLTHDPLAPRAQRSHSKQMAWRKILANIPGAHTIHRLRLQARLDRHPNTGWIYHEPNYLALRFDGPTVITVHDLAWIRHPETHPIQRVRHLNRHFPHALERADHILTVSAFTRDELMNVFGLPAERITVTPLGVDHIHYRPRSQQDCAQTLQTPYLKDKFGEEASYPLVTCRNMSYPAYMLGRAYLFTHPCTKASDSHHLRPWPVAPRSSHPRPKHCARWEETPS
ncbi:MAG: glycosyltransferase [Halothiobacillus sp.]|nr:glycosyltransferase [Halothiobacillus sp.]